MRFSSLLWLSRLWILFFSLFFYRSLALILWISSTHPHLRHLTEPLWKTLHISSISLHSVVKKIKVRPRLINSGDVQSSRFLVLFIFESCDLPSLWSSSVTRLRDHGLSSSQDQVYQAGHRYARSSAHALLKPRLRGQMLNTSNPISVWQDLKGSGPLPYKWRVNTAARRLNISEVIRQNAGCRDTAADGASHLGFKLSLCRKWT